MIPIKNKKKKLQATIEEMTNFALTATFHEKYFPNKTPGSVLLIQNLIIILNLKIHLKFILLC